MIKVFGRVGKKDLKRTNYMPLIISEGDRRANRRDKITEQEGFIAASVTKLPVPQLRHRKCDICIFLKVRQHGSELPTFTLFKLAKLAFCKD